MLELSNIQEIPATISQLKSLESIHFTGNENLQLLPENFGELENVGLCDFSSCNIQKLPISMSKMNNMRVLDLANNPQIDKNTLVYLPKKLNRLNLSYCNLNTLPISLKDNFPKKLILRGNPLLILPDWLTSEQQDKIIMD